MSGFCGFALSIFKSVAIKGRGKLQLRSEIFNLFNRAHFSQPNAVTDAPLTVGRISATAIDSRQIQLAVKDVF
ncbi:MAG TPA: hypothetical protein VNJ02_20075 [Vicinamibacterales bacterium]|nr:hypothetical protein [Vicinamibacterales bacterium]